jgi:hypothetical protein
LRAVALAEEEAVLCHCIIVIPLVTNVIAFGLSGAANPFTHSPSTTVASEDIAHKFSTAGVGEGARGRDFLGAEPADDPTQHLGDAPSQSSSAKPRRNRSTSVSLLTHAMTR